MNLGHLKLGSKAAHLTWQLLSVLLNASSLLLSPAYGLITAKTISRAWRQWSFCDKAAVQLAATSG